MSDVELKPTPGDEPSRDQGKGGEQAGATAAPETGGGQAAADPVKALEEKVAALEEENSFLKDQLLRKTADFENFRKRMLREKEEAIRYANGALLSDILPILDDFERAIQSSEESRDFDSFHEGVTMIEKRLVSTLERNWGLKRFASIGDEFDPDRHQAIALEESEHDTSVVLEDYQKGYLLHDRVLRPARVKVSKPAAGNTESNASDNREE